MRIGNPSGVGQILIDASAPFNSQGSPGLAFNGDTSTGMYQIAGGTIGFAASGTLRFTINPSGLLQVPSGYDTLVVVDEAITNKKYVDDAIVAATPSTINDLPQFNVTLPLDDNDFLVSDTNQMVDKTPTEVRTILGLVSGGSADIWVEKVGDAMDPAASLTFSGGGEVLGLPAIPTTAGSAASKAYVDALFSGLDPKEAVLVSTEDYLDNLGNGTWTALGGGVGKTLTAGAAGTTTFDGQALIDGNRVLVKDEVSSGGSTNLDEVDNGIYIVSNAAVGLQTVLTRSTDFDGDPAGEVSSGNFVFIQEGTSFGKTGWLTAGSGTITVDTDPIVWIQVSGAAQITDGAGLLFTGNVLDVRDGPGIGIVSDFVAVDFFDTATGAIILTTDGTSREFTNNGAGVHLLLDGSTLTQGAPGLKVSSNGITGTEINASAAGLGLGGGGGSPLSVNVDNPSGVVITGDAVGLANVPNSSLTNSTIAFEVFDSFRPVAGGPTGSQGTITTSLGAQFTMTAGSGIELSVVGSDLNVTANISSVHGRFGAIVGANGDYSASQINYSDVAVFFPILGQNASDVQDAIDTLVSVLSTTTVDQLVDADADTRVTVENSADEDTVRIDLGPSPTGYATTKTNALVLSNAGLSVDLSDTATGLDQAGAPISVVAGNGAVTNGNGGDITLTPGLGAGSGATGDLRLTRGQVLTLDGTAAVPTYSFISDTDSGLYRQPGGTIAVAKDSLDMITLVGTGIRLDAQPGSVAVGGTIWLASGNGDTTFAGGDINLDSGFSGSGSTVAGNISLFAGNIPPTTTQAALAQIGGNLTLRAGVIRSTNAGSTPGQTIVLGGDNILAGPAGPVDIRGGVALVGNGGDVLLRGGRGSSGPNDGSITISTTDTDGRRTELRFLEDAANGTKYVGFKAPADMDAASTGDGNTTVWTLPEGDGAATEVLTTDGAGNLSWSAGGGGGTPGGADTHIQFNDVGVFGGEADLTWNKTTDTMSVGASSGGTITTSTINGNLTIQGNGTGLVVLGTPVQLDSHVVASLPAVSPAGQMIYVSDESGGAIPAFSDGTNWRRTTDRAIVS